jgi:hypothetical protein
MQDQPNQGPAASAIAEAESLRRDLDDLGDQLALIADRAYHLERQIFLAFVLDGDREN